ncbi:MAG TPA: hypothetical protein VN876_04610 [Gemmatimonadaceae bacterium]|nr:hypothetical protein [Gemmatimonadaceae bacterium]
MRKSIATIGMSLAAAAASISIPAFATSSAFASPVPVSQGAVIPQQAAPAKTGARARREAHPEIRKAIAALERAKTDMQRASHDFGGHRADALAACDKAIEQLKLALQYDKR